MWCTSQWEETRTTNSLCIYNSKNDTHICCLECGFSVLFCFLSEGLETDFQGVFSTFIFFPLTLFPTFVFFFSPFFLSLCPLDLKNNLVKFHIYISSGASWLRLWKINLLGSDNDSVSLCWTGHKKEKQKFRLRSIFTNSDHYVHFIKNIEFFCWIGKSAKMSQ